jgi:hypothetical protein
MTDWQGTSIPSIRISPPKRPLGAREHRHTQPQRRHNHRRQQHQPRSRQGYAQARPVELRLAQIMRPAVEGRPGIRLEIGRRLLAAGPAAEPGAGTSGGDRARHASAVFAEPIGRSPRLLCADARYDGGGRPAGRGCTGRTRARCCRQMLSVRMKTSCLRICAAQPLSSLVFC